MHFEQRHLKRRHGEQGFSLIGALFLLVVIGLLVSVALSFAAAQQGGISSQLLRVRANLAVQSGLEWAAWQLRRNTLGAFAAACQSAGVLPQPPALAGTLADYSVSVNCSATSHSQDAATIWLYRLHVTAMTSNRVPGQPDYAEAAVSALVEGG